MPKSSTASPAFKIRPWSGCEFWNSPAHPPCRRRELFRWPDLRFFSCPVQIRERVRGQRLRRAAHLARPKTREMGWAAFISHSAGLTRAATTWVAIRRACSHVPTDTSSAPTAAPTRGFDGRSSSAAAGSCYTLLAAHPSTRDGTYWLDPDGIGTGASPAQVTCDMTGGGYNVVNYRRQIDVGGRHRRQQTTFTTANFNAPAALFRFGRVIADFEFAGELDDSACQTPFATVGPELSSDLTPTSRVANELTADKRTAFCSGCVGTRFQILIGLPVPPQSRSWPGGAQVTQMCAPGSTTSRSASGGMVDATPRP